MDVPADAKLAIGFDPIGGLTMDDLSFSVVFFTTDVRVCHRVPKSEMTRISDSQYSAIACSRLTGPGTLKFKIIVEVPDSDARIHGGIRYECETITTDIVFKR